jgi:cell division protein FtsI (penicillin-binding protein 3)
MTLADPRRPAAQDLRAGRAPLRQDQVVHLDGSAKRVLETGRTRLLVTGALFAIAFAVIGLRLTAVALLQQGDEPRIAQAGAAPALAVERADIVDRNGVVLATSLPTASLYANPQLVLDPEDAAARIVGVLPALSQAEVASKLAAEKSFVWIKRNLTPREQYQVNRLGIPGVYFQTEERRVYPQGALTAHVVGFTDIDNRGLAGIEQSFDDVLRDSRRPVRLSIDVRLQHILREELGRAIADFTGIGGAGAVLDVQTGELMALVSLPDFDPNQPGTASEDARFNRASLGIYEMGSTFKVFNTALALDSGVVRLTDQFDATKPIRIGGFSIRDYHGKNAWLSVPEIFMYSSNIGSAKMAEEVGGEAQKAFFGRLGMLRPASVELPEVGQPLYPGTWRPINTMTIAYGHGLAVSPLHLVSGVAAVVNGGIMRPATLIAREASEVSEGERIISAATSEQMRQLLRLVVEAGTGKNADVPGYVVGGKTGTADKQSGNGYNRNSRLASFVAAFPMTAPRYVVLVMVDEPKPNATSYGYATGGWVAAPAVGRIVQRMAPLIGMVPLPIDTPDGTSDLLIAVNAMEEARAVE